MISVMMVYVLLLSKDVSKCDPRVNWYLAADVIVDVQVKVRLSPSTGCLLSADRVGDSGWSGGDNLNIL